MGWIVLGEDGGRIKLISSRETKGMVPKGSFLTVDRGNEKHILRVDQSAQSEPYSPSPLIAEMDLSPLVQDQECRNLILAYRVRDISDRQDGLVAFIPPQTQARRATQEEVNEAIGTAGPGPKVFIATVQANQNQILRDEAGLPITATLPQDMFYHQLLICGKTGSGKTVAAKYLSQYFAEEMDGAVLAVNVKDVDFLKMDQPSLVKNPAVAREWSDLGQSPRGLVNFTVYYPATAPIDPGLGVDAGHCTAVTLDVRRIEPESLIGLLGGISDLAAQNLPNIFRHWQTGMREKDKPEGFSFSTFSRYFAAADQGDRSFPTLNVRGDESTVTLHKATFDNILRNLDSAAEFFDNEDADRIDETNILVRGKVSVINVAGKKGTQFGSVLLRDLLHRIVEAKSHQQSKVPILIIIDEVHQFYNTDSSREALGDLDTICRTGRSILVGVLFSSQTPSDIPRGLSSVINTKIFFKTDVSSARDLGVRVTPEEMEGLRSGYAVASIHNASMLKVLKFPVSLAGVFE